MSKRTKSKVKEQAGLSVYHTIPAQEADTHFIGTVQKVDTGANNYLNEFMQIMRDVLARRGSFSFSDVVTTNHVTFEIPFQELKDLWERYAAQMMQICRWERIEGAYDEPVYISIR